MGYTNRDQRLVNVTRKEKRAIRAPRRCAERRQLRGEHLRHAGRAMRRGWWYA